jgi:FkbM family methyltransferase
MEQKLTLRTCGSVHTVKRNWQFDLQRQRTASGFLVRFALVRKLCRRLAGALIARIRAQTAAQGICDVLIEHDLLRYAPDDTRLDVFKAIVECSPDALAQKMTDVFVGKYPEIAAQELVTKNPQIAAVELVIKNPQIAAAELVSKNPEIAAAELVSKNPEIAAAELVIKNSQIAAAELVIKYPQIAAAELVSKNPEIAAAELVSKNPKIAAAELVIKNPQIAAAELVIKNPQIAAVELTTKSPQVVAAELAKKNPRIAAMELFTKNLEIAAAHFRFAPMFALRQESYAQEGEDLVLARIFNAKKDGFYVDVGAHHPIRFSNTYLLYLRGWRGLNIDAVPNSMEEFRRVRPRDINVECLVSSSDESQTFYVLSEPALSTVSEKLARQRSCEDPSHSITRTIALTPRRLASILDEFLPPGQMIDLLNVDVEGLDLEVLQSNDWTRYRPAVVLAEVLATTPTDQDDIVRYLREKGYRMTSKFFNTALFQLIE